MTVCNRSWLPRNVYRGCARDKRNNENVPDTSIIIAERERMGIYGDTISLYV